MRRLFSALFAFVLCLSVSAPAFATELEPTNTDVALDIPVIYFENATDYQQYFNNLKEVSATNISQRGATVISASVIRSGTSDDCELYLNWTGDDLYSAFRYKKMTVKSTSILFAETYGTFGNGSSYETEYVTAAAIGSTKIGDVTIDSDVEKVKVSSSGLQGYKMSSASWLSALEFTGTVTIN